jgi:lipopolysaccharide transport system permease protein
MIMSFMAASGLGALLASINVRFRDVRYALPFIIQTLFFLTPVIYPTSMIPENYRWILSLNPMSGIINSARSVLLHQGTIPYNELAVSLVVITTLFIFGLYLFRRTERIFADVS